MSGRREAIKYFAVGAAGVCLSAFEAAIAQDLVALKESDSLAQALDYHVDASTVDRTEYPEYQAGQQCSSCLQAVPSANSLGCKLAPGKAVNMGGWCKLWASKA